MNYMLLYDNRQGVYWRINQIYLFVIYQHNRLVQTFEYLVTTCRVIRLLLNES